GAVGRDPGPPTGPHVRGAAAAGLPARDLPGRRLPRLLPARAPAAGRGGGCARRGKCRDLSRAVPALRDLPLVAEMRPAKARGRSLELSRRDLAAADARA